ncbi:MAG: diguanylate cyclase [Ruminococcus sp.]|nr:diguanylate cyclase [Ruminococcus sp.]
MDTNAKSIKISKRNIFVTLALILMTNLLLSTALSVMAKRAIREQMNERMLDIANTAAYMLDGDVLESLTADDEGTEDFNKIYGTLKVFQNNIRLDYIYSIRDMGDGTFTFIIDPDEEPAEFGSLIETTEALVKASQGTPSVDTKAYSDEWGTFYSAYSPVYDSKGNIAGIVGVDFGAEWYDSTLNSNRLIAVIITAAALAAGILISFFMIRQNKKQLAGTVKTIEELDDAAQRIGETIIRNSVKKRSLHSESGNAALKAIAEGDNEVKPPTNEYEALTSSLTSVYGKLKNYLDYINAEVYTDIVTDAGNKAAYTIHIEKLAEDIKAGTACFSVAFFDINGLKKIYTAYGYEAGDALLFECSRIIKKIFDRHPVYHITGDEFIVITDGNSMLDMEILLAKFDNEIKRYNAEQDDEHKLSVAKGASVFNPKKSASYREVFIEAKERCDEDKAEYYRDRK